MASKYIDVEEVFNLLADAPQAIVPKAIWKVGIRSILDQCNAVDIVRCKECRHYHNQYGDSACMLHYDFEVTPDDFCSYGERRSE